MNLDTLALMLLTVLQTLPTSEYRERRERLLARHADGIIEAGAEGPSFWPWTMSGPNAHSGNLVRSFYDYHHLDREMKGR
ncbi:MAG: hypothetical protein E2P02_27285 [Acidobacteria bacterium]|nr:MAG: hypothetical protein E2P02_27285 [Acidobacteriota bacterium]